MMRNIQENYAIMDFAAIAMHQQECIPVECVPSTAVAIAGGCLPGGMSAWGVSAPVHAGTHLKLDENSW